MAEKEIKQGSSGVITITSPFEAGTQRHEFSREAVLRDFRVGWRSRHTSVLARREVMAGRAKFGIFGDGKEVAQLAMAYAFERGDFRSGYYRDQTFMFALGAVTVQEFFAQLYAHADLVAEPAFGGRSMTGHFATRLLKTDGSWKNQLELYNSSADLSPTAAQMPRLVGLAYASKLYRQIPKLQAVASGFSNNGDEVAFGTIGNASCAEGMFWESVNAVGVLQVPMLLSIWDDGYGISVPNEFQMTKGSISKLLGGFQEHEGGDAGLEIHTVPGWDYAALCTTYYRTLEVVRRDHRPAILHVTELTQPLGHSTSGSHQRYKSEDRLAWEEEYDCLRKMREWILDEGMASEDELDALEQAERQRVEKERDRAWEAYRAPLDRECREVIALAETLVRRQPKIRQRVEDLRSRNHVLRRDLMRFSTEVLIDLRDEPVESRLALTEWKKACEEESRLRYSSELYSEGYDSALDVKEVEAEYATEAESATGFAILNACFDAAFKRVPQLVAFGEDIGRLGDVNQGLAHLQEKYGELRISDTGIRETTIIGQAIGLALRGLRPIAEIQYLDYILYALQIMSDDLATLRWRTRGGQKAPVIIRTRGHRLEGIWHSGSPMAGILHLLRGMHVCVPRDATQAAGFYNTVLDGEEPALLVEVLNAYRSRAPMPSNIGELRVPLGVPEVLRVGTHVTLVTYGACCPIALESAEQLSELGIETEVIDVRTLLPFDVGGLVGESIRKTNRVLFVDEDVPGGATAYMMQRVLEAQGAHDWLDAPARTLTAAAHRPPYGTDGDYFSKPNRETILEAVYDLMHESDAEKYPRFLR